MNKKLIIIFSLLFLLLMITNVSASDTNVNDKIITTTDADEVISSADVVNETSNNVLSTLDTFSKDNNEFSEIDNILNLEDTSSCLEDKNIYSNDVLESNSQEILSNNLDENILKDTPGTLKDLNNLISSASGEVILTKDYAFKSGTDSSSDYNIVINGKNSLIINGNGHTIDGKSSTAPCFSFQGGSKNCVLKNINFINFAQSSNYCSCVSFSSCSACSIIDCNFSKCTTTQWGAGIFIGNKWLPSSSSVSISDITIRGCRFTDLTSGAGGSIYFAGHQDGISIDRVLIEDSYFYNSRLGESSTSRGSAMEVNANHVSIIGCTFLKCHASSGSGVIGLFSYGPNAYIANCYFINNTAKQGGAISSENAGCLNTTVFNCTFIGNTASNGNGGAITFYGAQSTINNCTFINNHANGNGGAIAFNAESSSIINSSFINDTASSSGGAVYSNAQGSVVDSCNFENCSASTSNYFYQGYPITFKNTYFPEVYVGNDNAAGDSLDPSSLGTFDTGMKLVATDGTMYIVGSLTNFKNHNVTRSITIKAYDDSSRINLENGGRAFIISASDVSLRDLIFTSSKYDGDGGVLYWQADNGYIYRCSFLNNEVTSSGKGGAIYVGKGSDILIIEQSTFNNNKAYDGGSIYVDNVTDNSLIYNSSFDYCTASHYGGALYYAGEICYYIDDDTSFKSNTATAESAYKNIYDREATKCMLDVYVSNEGTGNGSSFESPTNFNRGFSLVAPNGKVHFVNQSEVYILNDEYSTSKFNISFEGNGSTLTGFKLTVNPSAHSIKF